MISIHLSLIQEEMSQNESESKVKDRTFNCRWDLPKCRQPGSKEILILPLKFYGAKKKHPEFQMKRRPLHSAKNSDFFL